MARTQIDLSTQSMDGSLINSKIANNQITDEKINSNANISISKLNTTNADFDSIGKLKSGVVSDNNVSSSANISISKLNTTNADFDNAGKLKAGVIYDTNVASSAAISYSKLNLTGSIVNADISNAANIATSKLAEGPLFIKKDGSVAFENNLSMGGNRIVNLATPVEANDAATKAYVDGAVSGLTIKAPVRVVATSNISLSGLPTIDGVTLQEGDRILVVGQTDPVANGVYIASTNTWTRASDFAAGIHAAEFFTFVEEGSEYADTGWVCTSDPGSDVIGTNPLNFVQFSAAGQIQAGNGLVKTGNTIDIVAADSTIVIAPDSIRVNTGTGPGQIVQLDNNAKLPAVDGSQLLNVDAELFDGLDSTSFVRTDASSTILSGNTLSIASGATFDLNGTFKFGGVIITATADELNSIGNIVTRETPSGVIDGVNKNFTLSHTPIPGSEMVFLNGVLQDDGGNDYSISGNTIVFVDAPPAGSKIKVTYRYH